MDLLKESEFGEDFQITITKEIQTLLNKTMGTAELYEIPQGGLLILKIPIPKKVLKDTVDIIKAQESR